MRRFRLCILGNLTLLETSTNSPVKLRSHSCMELLIALLVSDLCERHRNGSKQHSREWLSHIIWPDAADPRAALRQALWSIRTAASEDLLRSTRQFVAINHIALDSDLSDLLAVVNAILALPSSTNPREVTSIGADLCNLVIDDLLEFGFEPGSDLDLCLKGIRAGLIGNVVSALRRLQHAYVAVHEYHAALTVANKVLVFSGNSRSARASHVQLLKRIGMPDDTNELNAALKFEDNIKRASVRERKGKLLLESERSVLNKELKQRFAMLSAVDQAKLTKLSLLPGAFRPALAEAVTGATESDLQLYVKHLFVDRSGGIYGLLKPVKAFLQYCTAEPDRAHVKNRITQQCLAWLQHHFHQPDNPRAGALFKDLSEAKPFISAACNYVQELEANQVAHDLLYFAFAAGLSDCVKSAYGWIDTQVNKPALQLQDLSAHLRSLKARSLAITGNYREAAEHSTIALAAFTMDNKFWLGTASHAAEFLHRAERYEEALAVCGQAREYFRNSADLIGRQNWLRFESEIHLAMNSLGNAEECLNACMELLGNDNGTELVRANCYYWLAHIALQSSDHREAETNLLKSIEIRSQKEDLKGEAQSLALLAELYSRTGRHTEAIITCRSSLRLIDMLNDPNSRASILGNMAQVYARYGLTEDARKFGNEALTHWTSVGHSNWIQYAQQILQSIGQQTG